ncbi:hypothetical protein [Nesterenkonia pannonica]|uniref:hypothetical protein n=1 Tax=Nesterenkonia pannonica TaxID=1548602 RepID=UPI002164CFB7|nr:hypothetical protein [Nesterenkonia pannonica]
MSGGLMSIRMAEQLVTVLNGRHVTGLAYLAKQTVLHKASSRRTSRAFRRAAESAASGPATETKERSS